MSSLSSSLVSLADSSSIRSSSASTEPSPFSSGLTTPADDCLQPLYNVAGCSPTLDCKDGVIQCDEMATPKPLSLSKGFKRATKFAQRLVTLKSKRIKSLAVSNSTSKMEPPLLVRTVRGPQRGVETPKRVFSLPNDQNRPHLKRRPALSSIRPSPALRFAEGIIPGLNTPVVDDPVGTFEGQSSSADDPVAPPPAPRQSLGIFSVLTLAAKVVCFLPWCIAVGAALSLAPQYSELVAFQTGYVSSLQGVRRFAHWAECGLQQVAIFFASIAVLGYFQMALGVTVAALVLSRFIFVWQDFEFDQSIPLGEDDRQSLYRIAVLDNYGLDKNTVVFTKLENGEPCRSVIVGEDLATEVEV